VAVAPLLDRLGSVTAVIDMEPEAVALARLRDYGDTLHIAQFLWLALPLALCSGCI